MTLPMDGSSLSDTPRRNRRHVGTVHDMTVREEGYRVGFTYYRGIGGKIKPNPRGNGSVDMSGLETNL